MTMRKFSSVQKKKFEEERARRILAHFYPNKYKESILTERPDIVNEKASIGVEVTDSMKQSIQQNFARASSITGKRKGELDQNDRSNINRNRVFKKMLSTGQYVAGISFWGNYHNLTKAFQKKIKALNKPGFQLYEENNLFIYSWFADKDEIGEFISYLQKTDDASLRLDLSDSIEHALFDFVYIFIGKEIIVITMKGRIVNRFKMDEDVMRYISEQSFIEVIDMTKDEFYSTNK